MGYMVPPPPPRRHGGLVHERPAPSGPPPSCRPHKKKAATAEEAIAGYRENVARIIALVEAGHMSRKEAEALINSTIPIQTVAEAQSARLATPVPWPRVPEALKAEISPTPDAMEPVAGRIPLPPQLGREKHLHRMALDYTERNTPYWERLRERGAWRTLWRVVGRLLLAVVAYLAWSLATYGVAYLIQGGPPK